jgi:hypothetical protein
MPTSVEKNQAGRAAVSRESWQGFLLSIGRIFVFQIVLALALSGTFVAYLNWSSAQIFAEFLSAGAVLSPSNPALQSIKGVNPCDRGA